MIDGDAVVFVYDEAARGSKPKEGVEVRGSFTAWGHADGWALERGKGGVWLLRKPRAEALIPGNSGWAEFKFVVDGETWLEAPASIPASRTSSWSSSRG